MTSLDCDVPEAVRSGLGSAGGKGLEVMSPNIGRQSLERGRVDEIDLHVAPVLLHHRGNANCRPPGVHPGERQDGRRQEPQVSG